MECKIIRPMADECVESVEVDERLTLSTHGAEGLNAISYPERVIVVAFASPQVQPGRYC